MAHRHDAAVFVDGARLFTAAVARGVSLRAMVEPVDALSLSLNKEGVFAGGRIVALETMVPRLAEDHKRARPLAELLSDLEGISVDMDTVQTNIVRVDIDCMSLEEFAGRVLRQGGSERAR